MTSQVSAKCSVLNLIGRYKGLCCMMTFAMHLQSSPYALWRNSTFVCLYVILHAYLY